MSKINASAGGFDYKIELEEAIEFLSIKYSETKSPTIGFNYYFLATEKAQKESDYFSAARMLEHLIVIIEDNKSVYNDIRYGVALLNIANNMIHLVNFSDAMQYIQKAKKYFIDQTVNMSILEEIEFYIYFYSSD